jgi:hypothetical protein
VDTSTPAMLTPIDKLARDERGAVLAMVALWLPMLMLFSAFVIDVGNWYTHKRHLQTQADAAALAGGTAFTFPCSDTAIEAQARNYAGASASTPAASYNSQVGGTPPGRIHALLNSSQYYSQNPGAPQTGYGDLGAACTTDYLDVKMTESNLPWFLSPGRIVPAINAHARVSLVQETTKAGSIPVAIPDPGYAVTAAAVEFMNEDTGTSLGSSALKNTGSLTWDNSLTPVSVNMAGATHVGAIIKLSGATPPPSPLVCGQALTQCYDLSSLDVAIGAYTRGAIFIHGYPTAGYTTPGSTGEPSVKGVTLVSPGGSTGCVDQGYFFAITSGTCQLGVHAIVTFPAGSGNTSVSATLSDYSTPTDYSHTESLHNVPNGSTTWTSDGTGQGKYFSVPAFEGPVKVTLTWSKTGGTYNGLTCTNGGGNPCKGSWSISGAPFVFQRAMSGGDPYTGPIASAAIYEGATQYADSFANDDPSGTTPTTHQLYVKLNVQPALGYATSVTSPPVYLRVEGNQNQTIDCDPSRPNLRQELDFGCAPQYTVNNLSGGTFSVDCSTWPTSNNSWTPPNYAQPWPCVSVQTGGAGGQVGPGIEDRMTRLSGGICPANNWTSFPNFSPTDPRLVSVILTPFGTFGGNGNTNIPVTGFAEFYITGWAKTGGGKHPAADCSGDDVPPGADYIVGHFVKYVDTLNSGGGTAPCDPLKFGNCVAVLTQ